MRRAFGAAVVALTTALTVVLGATPAHAETTGPTNGWDGTVTVTGEVACAEPANGSAAVTWTVANTGKTTITIASDSTSAFVPGTKVPAGTETTGVQQVANSGVYTMIINGANPANSATGEVTVACDPDPEPTGTADPDPTGTSATDPVVIATSSPVPVDLVVTGPEIAGVFALGLMLVIVGFGAIVAFRRRNRIHFTP